MRKTFVAITAFAFVPFRGPRLRLEELVHEDGAGCRGPLATLSTATTLSSRVEARPGGKATSSLTATAGWKSALSR